MDPNQLPTDPQPTPEYIAPTPATYPAPAPLSPSPVSTGKPKAKLFALIAGIVIIVGVILAGAWILYFSSAAQAKRLSANFMHAITTGDVAKATDLTGDSSAKSFLTTTSSTVHGTYKLAQSKFTDGKGYYLYDLTGANKKYARTIVQHDNGKRVVHSLVVSNTALALVPGNAVSVDTSTTTTPTSPSQPTTTSSGACLTANDFSFFSNLGGSLPDANGSGIYSDFYQLEFNSDAATYKAGANPDPNTVFNDFKTFYAQNASKKYAIELEASVNSATPDETLANARNKKVQSDLETISGIPASKITIQPITNDTSSSTAGNAFYRQVQITLRSDVSCVSQH